MPLVVIHILLAAWGIFDVKMGEYAKITVPFLQRFSLLW